MSSHLTKLLDVLWPTTLVAAAVWLLATAATESLGVLAVGLGDLFTDPRASWNEALDTWFRSGSGAGVALAALTSAIIELFRTRPGRGHMYLLMVGLIGVVTFAVLTHKIVTDDAAAKATTTEKVHEAKQFTGIMLVSAIAFGVATAFANSWAKFKPKAASAPNV